MSEATDNPARYRYEMVIDGEIARVDYTRDAGRLVLKHTEVPQALAGRGVGSMLARSVLQDARRRGLTIVPACEFIAAFIQRHPEFADVVAGSGEAS
jgi:predicted GNAT family acetyltransferase